MERVRKILIAVDKSSPNFSYISVASVLSLSSTRNWIIEFATISILINVYSDFAVPCVDFTSLRALSCTIIISTMFLSDSLPSEIRFRQAYTLSLYLSVVGRVSPVPNHTFHTYRFLYTEGFFRAAFQFLHTFHGFRPYAQGSTSLCSLFRDLFNDTAEFHLMLRSAWLLAPLIEVILSTRLAPCITTTHRV